MSRIIAWWSGGITSAVACALALKEHENVELVYIHLNQAHKDTQRFKEDCEAWYGRKIRSIQSGKYNADVLDCIEQRGFINGPFGASCTKYLKKEVRQIYQAHHEFDHHVMGFEFDVDEIQRAVEFKMDYATLGPLFPLIDAKLTKAQCAGIILSAGIALPEMYNLGYHNNNCVGCVKGGMGYWNKIRVDFPAVFERMKEAEERVGHSCINGTFLKDLTPEQGRHEPPIAPECGPFCGEDATSIFRAKAESIFRGQMTMALV